MTLFNGNNGKRGAFWSLAVALAVVAFPTLARADNLDEELLKKAPTIMKDLQDHLYKNVGVLKFQVQRGERSPSLAVGLLNANLATRLEYALVLVNNEKSPIGITRDASQVIAAGDKKASYLKPADRANLFKVRFPLAWGSDKVTVDAFLTGTVKISPDMKKTTVIIQAFDRKANELREVVNFTVRTDRSILADSGTSFALAKRGDFIKRRDADLDDDAAKSAEDRDKGKKVAKDKDAIENLIDFNVFYNDEQVQVSRNDKGEAGIDEPQEGMKVHFAVANKSSERLALVIRVNGINTLLKEGTDKEVKDCMKWVLEPGKRYIIRGFYLEDGKTVERFKVVAPEGLSDLDPKKLGLLELDVFREGGGEAGESLARSRKVSLRGLSAKETKAKTFADLKSKVLQHMKARTKPILYAGDADSTDVKETQFNNPMHTGSMVIRYYQAKTSQQ